ncbi:unnamed protein product, partial [marine sediment metagenome]
IGLFFFINRPVVFFAPDCGDGVCEGSENVINCQEDCDICECDINHDGICDMQDWNLYGEDTGRTDCTSSSDPCECDLNHDGICDMHDWNLYGEDTGRTDCPIRIDQCRGD